MIVWFLSWKAGKS